MTEPRPDRPRPSGMDLAGCTTEVVTCDDTGQAGGLDLALLSTQAVIVLAVLLLAVLLLPVRRKRRRHRVRRPPARRVWVNTAGDLVDGPP